MKNKSIVYVIGRHEICVDSTRFFGALVGTCGGYFGHLPLAVFCFFQPKILCLKISVLELLLLFGRGVKRILYKVLYMCDIAKNPAITFHLLLFDPYCFFFVRVLLLVGDKVIVQFFKFSW